VADETENLQNQLNLQQSINKALADRQGLLASQNQAMGTQANLAQALEGLFGDMAGSAEEGSNNASNLAEALQRAQESAGAGSSSSNNLAAALEGATKASMKLREDQKGFWTKFKEGVEEAKNLEDIMEEVSKVSLGDMADALGLAAENAGILGTALAGISLGDLAATFSNTFKQIGGVISGAFGAISNIGQGIFGALSGAMGLLAEAGQQSGSASVEVANAWEKVKGSVGDGSDYDAVKTAVSNLGMEGASTAQMFGSGPGGMAAAIQYAGEVAAEMGDTLGRVADDFAQNVDSYTIANKALGISGESMSNMYLMATHAGSSVSEMMDTQARMTVYLSDKFGVSSKAIGKNLNDMMGDYSTFGGMAESELTATAAYAAKLGIAMKDLQGITAKTDDFEGAAEAASGLAASFGMTVDTMELMNADPAEKAEMIRQSFLETGQSFEDMSRQEKARMADLTGMSQEALAGAFDPANADVNLEDMEKAAEAAGAGAISQEEANMRLARSIEKVHEALGGGTEQMGGPFSAFMQGVVDGITNSKEFLALAQNFQGVIEVMYKSGKEIGKMFVDMFPGVQQLFEGLTGFFDPAKWTMLMKDITGAFSTFFEELATDPEAAIQNLMDRVMGIFENFFSTNGEAVSKMQEGATNMINAIGGIISGMIPWLTEKLVLMIAGLADALSGSGTNTTDRSTIGGALMGAFGDAFNAIIDALPDIAIALFKGLAQVMWAHKGKVLIALGLVAGWMALQFTFQLGKAVLFEYLKAKILNKLTNKMKGDLPSPDQAPGPSKGIMESMGETIKEIGKINLGDVAKAIAIAAMLVVFIGVSMVGMAAAIWVSAKILDKVDFDDIAKSLIAMGAAVGGVWVLSKIAKTLKVNVLVQGGLGMLAGALFLAVAGSAFAGAIWLISKILEGIDFMRTVEMFAIVGLAIGATFLMALAGLSLIADGGITLLMGGLGMLAGALFLAVSGMAYALAIQGVFATFVGIDFVRAAEIFGTLGIAILATAGLAIAGAALTLAMPILIAAVPGLKAGATLLEVGAGIYATALTAVVNRLSKVPGGMNKIDQALGILAGSMGTIAGMAVLGAAFRLFMPLVGMLTEGLEAAGDFAATGFEQVGRVLDAIMRIPIADPTRTKAVIDITGTIVGAMADIAGLGIQMAAVSAVGSLFGDTDMDEMINMSVRFIEAVGDTLARLIILLVTAAGDMDEGAIKGAGAIGGMIGAVASLSEAMSGPINAITENHGAIDSLLAFIGAGSSEAEKIASVVSGMTDLLEAVGPSIPRLVDAMTDGLSDMPAGMGEKAKAFGDMLGGVSEVLGMWDDYDNKISKKEAEADSDLIEGGFAFKDTKFARDITSIGELLSWEGWAEVAANVAAAGSFVVAPGAGNQFNQSFQEVAQISEDVTEALNRILDSGIEEWNVEWASHVTENIAAIVGAYNEGAALLANITPINIDAVLEEVNKSLAVRRDRVTIEDQGVTINMSLNVSMEARRVARVLIQENFVAKGTTTA
jgi:hypothetical protein